MDIKTTSKQDPLSADTRRRAETRTRLAISCASAAAVILLLALSLHASAAIPAPQSASLIELATVVVSGVNVTVVLSAVAALTVVAVLRRLHYGIGVVLTCCIGSILTAPLVHQAAGSWVTAADLPNGQVTAIASVLASASMVSTAAVRPVVLGLGASATIAVAAAATITGSASLIGICGALAVVAVWWSACSIVMLHSPVAAAREARNPLDTAAMVAQRKMGRF